MRPRTAVLTIAAAAVLLQAVNVRAQATNPPYVGRMPSAARLKADIKGADAEDTSARYGAALVLLSVIIENLSRSRPGGLTPDEKRLIAGYTEARHRLDSPPGAFYLRDPAFRDELLRRYFPAEVRAEYYLVTGKRPPDPPGAAAAKSPAAANPAAAKGALYLADYSYRLGVASEKAGNEKAATGQFAAAVENYKQAIEYDPALTQAYLGLGNIYMNYRINYELAVPLWKRLINLTPDNASIHGLLGQALYQLKRYDEALEAFRDATRLKGSPDVLAIAHYNIGLTHLRMGQKERALEAYRKLQTIDQAEAQKLYAKINEATGSRPAAKGGNAASPPAGGAKSAPTPAAPAYVAEGDKYLQAGEFTNAVEAFKKAISLEPSGYAYNQLGNSYDGLGQQANALAAYMQAARLLPDDPVIRHNLGSTYLLMQQYDNAKASLLEVLRLKPDHADAFNLLGVAYFRLKQYPEAAVQFQQGLRIKPDDAVLLHNIGKTNFYMGRKEEARRIYEKLLTVDKEQAQKLYEVINAGAAPGPGAKGGARSPARPSARPGARGGGSADEYLAEGEKYFEAKDYARAVEAFKEAIALKPSDEAYGWLGLARQRLKQYPEAVTAHQQAVKLNPTEASHHSNLGNVYLLMGQNEKAVNPLRESLRLEPEPAVHVLLAITYHKLEQFPEEVMVLQQALKLAPNDASAHLQLGYAYVALRRKAEALQTFRSLQAIDPERAKSLRGEIEAYLGTDDPKLFWRVADAALESKDYESMLTAYHHIIALKPADSAVVARARNGRGQAFVGLKKYERAAAEYREAIRRDPTQPGYYLNLGTTYLAMGKKAQAQQVYNTLLTLDRQKAQQLYAEIGKVK